MKNSSKHTPERAHTRNRCAPNEEGRKQYIHEHKEIGHELYFMEEEIKHMMSNGFKHEKTELVDTIYHVVFVNPENGTSKEVCVQYQENFDKLAHMFNLERAH
jgi:hypothetical protein